MKLHEDPSTFRDVILATAQDLKISDVFIEKDYWVTFILYRISQHPEMQRIVFKGGTSLSKAFALIERFSEDVDLALTDLKGLSGNKIKSLIDKISKNLTANPFEEIGGDKRTSKGSRFRRTVHQYPRLDLTGEFQSASPDLLLEINSFTDPTPILRKKVRAYVGDFLARNSSGDLKTFDLDSFEIQVLGLERTCMEKLLGLIRQSYEGPQKTREKVRHLYDLAKLGRTTEIQNFISNQRKFKEMMELVKETDKTSSEFSGAWLDSPFYSAPLFNNSEIKKALEDAYQSRSFQSLIWAPDKSPSFEEAWGALSRLSSNFNE